MLKNTAEKYLSAPFGKVSSAKCPEREGAEPMPSSRQNRSFIRLYIFPTLTGILGPIQSTRFLELAPKTPRLFIGRHDTQHNDTQHNVNLHDGPNYDTQHNRLNYDTQRNGLNCVTKHNNIWNKR
jgi:hypothetical protein